MDDQLKILIEPRICSQIVENECEIFVDNKWDDPQLLGFLSLYLPEVVHLRARYEAALVEKPELNGSYSDKLI